jgi:glycosyltransferase involved in cell wall biosynthesis
MVGRQETGNETYVLNLIHGLTRLESATAYLLYTPDPTALGVCGQLPSNFAIRRVWPGRDVLRLTLALPAQVVRDDVDVLHVTYIAPPVTSAAVVATVHDVSYLEMPEAFSLRDRLVLGLLVPKTLRRAETIITVSEYSRQAIARYYGTDLDKIVVAYQSISPAFRPVAAAGARLVAGRYGLTGRYLLAVGNLQPRKNVPRLLRAFAMLRQTSGYTGRLALVGKDAGLESQIAAEARRLGLRHEVIFTGYVPQVDLVALYSCADTFIYPSLYEGFGLPPLEAMACGCPVIASNTSALPEVAADGALLVDPTSEEALAGAVVRVLGDTDLRRELVARGRARAARFTAAAFAQAVQTVYERAGALRGRARALTRVATAAQTRS